MNCGSSSCLKQFLTFRAFFRHLTFNAIKEIKAKDWFCCLSSHLVFMQNQFNPVNWEMDSISLYRSSTEYFTELLSNSCLWATKQETVRAYKCSWGQLCVAKSLLLLLMSERQRIHFVSQIQVWICRLNCQERRNTFMCKLSTSADVPLTPGGLWSRTDSLPDQNCHLKQIKPSMETMKKCYFSNFYL